MPTRIHLVQQPAWHCSLLPKKELKKEAESIEAYYFTGNVYNYENVVYYLQRLAWKTEKGTKTKNKKDIQNIKKELLKNINSNYFTSLQDIVKNIETIQEVVPETKEQREIQELKEHLIEELNLEEITPEEIDAEAPLFGDGLGLDSIDALEIILILEKYYGVKLANSAEAKPAFYSVKTLAEYIMQNRK